MTTDNSGFEGIDIDIATAIAEKLGLELVVDDMEFDAALVAARDRRPLGRRQRYPQRYQRSDRPPGYRYPRSGRRA